MCQDIHSLPLELHEMMLMNSLYRLTRTLLPIDARPDPFQKIKVETRAHVIAFKTLSSVCQHFHQVITKRDWFRRHLKTHLTGKSTVRPKSKQIQLEKCSVPNAWICHIAHILPFIFIQSNRILVISSYTVIIFLFEIAPVGFPMVENLCRRVILAK